MPWSTQTVESVFEVYTNNRDKDKEKSKSHFKECTQGIEIHLKT